MPNIKLPDGKKIEFSKSITGLEIAKKISSSLAKEALIISVNGILKDLNHEINSDSEVKILTSKEEINSQLKVSREAIEMLGYGKFDPKIKAAESIIKFIKNK